MVEGLLQRAQDRAQRRFRSMVATKAYADMGSPETRLYVQAERLVDSLLTELRWETAKAEFDALQAHDHDYHFYAGVTVAECEECLTAADPEWTPTFYTYAEWAPGELTEAFGK